MNSLGVFYDLNLKKSNDLMEVFDEALSKTNNLVETMDNYNTRRRVEKVEDNETNKNDNINFNSNHNSIRKNNRSKTNNPRKGNKTLKPITNQFYYRRREPYNYQKEYENELINQIEQLFNPSYRNDGKKEEVGMLSFLSPLINSNIEEKNKQFYKKKVNSPKINELINVEDKKSEIETGSISGESESAFSRGLNRKFSNSNQKFKISTKNTFARKGNELFENPRFKKTSKKFTYYNKYQKDKFNIPEIGELKKNRYFSRTKTNFRNRNTIVARDISTKSRKKESRVDQIISKLKKHYS